MIHRYISCRTSKSLIWRQYAQRVPDKNEKMNLGVTRCIIVSRVRTGGIRTANCIAPLELCDYGNSSLDCMFTCRIMISYIPSSARRRSGSARYFYVWHYQTAEKLHNNDADSSLQSMFTFSRPITALLTGALAVQGHGQVTWPSFQHVTSICSFVG